MRPSDLPIRTRLMLLGVFTNILLIVAVGLGAMSMARVNERLVDELATEAVIQWVRDLARSAQIDPRKENLQALNHGLESIGLAAAAISQLPEAQSGAAGNAKTLQQLDDLVEALGKHAQEQGEQSVREAEAEHRSSLILLAVVVAIAVVASTAVGLGNSHTIVPPLARAVGLAKAVASGDLTARIETGRRDELGQLLGAIRDMHDSLANIVKRVKSGASQVLDASSRIADSTTDLSSRTEQQATSLEETAASIEQMTATVDQNATNARLANERAVQAAQVARRGGEVVQKVVERMQAIQARSHQVSEIIVLIDSVAFQTNILALNAAVEAARAGESGLGFAVVAKEIRYLSQRTADSAKQIKELINDTVSEVDAGAALADDAGNTMAEVAASAAEVSSIISDIASATAEHQLGITHISTAVMELERVTQQNASMVQDSAGASESLRQMASQLERTVAFFKVENEDAAIERGPAAAITPTGRRVATAYRLSSVIPAASAAD